jgi:hypothetical protein
MIVAKKKEMRMNQTELKTTASTRRSNGVQKKKVEKFLC